MNNVAKVLIGVGIAVAGAFAGKKIYDKVTEKKYSDMKTTSQMDKEASKSEEAPVDDEFEENVDNEESTEDQSVFEKIKAGATKKVVDILMWAAEHPQIVSGLGVIASFGFTLIAGFRKMRTVDRVERQNREILKTLDRMSKKENPHDWMNTGYVAGYNACFDDTLSNIRDCAASGKPFTFYDSDNVAMETIKVEVM